MSTAASECRSGRAGAARPRMWWRCWRSSRASTPSRCSSVATTDRNSLPKLYGTGARPATPQARPTSRRDPHGRTDSQNRSMVGSGVCSSTPSCSPRLQGRRSWPIAGAGSTTHSGRTRPPRGSHPWGQLNRELQHDQTTNTHKTWTDEGAHVKETKLLQPALQTGCRGLWQPAHIKFFSPKFYGYLM